MISCNKKLKSAAKGFLCGMLLYLFREYEKISVNKILL